MVLVYLFINDSEPTTIDAIAERIRKVTHGGMEFVGFYKRRSIPSDMPDYVFPVEHMIQEKPYLIITADGDLIELDMYEDEEDDAEWIEAVNDAIWKYRDYLVVRCIVTVNSSYVLRSIVAELTNK